MCQNGLPNTLAINSIRRMEKQGLIHNKKLQASEFRFVLQDKLLQRCRDNPRYSLRAFAKSLQVSPSALSAMINGKRPITDKMTRKLGLELGLKLEQLDQFLSHSQSSTPTPTYQQLTLDTYTFISDWYHYAILELTRLKHFESDPAWISQTLGISRSETNAAIERLIRLGLLAIDKKGRMIDTSENGLATNINGDLTSIAAKKLQKQILEKSIKALEEVPVEDRNHTSMTMAIHPQDLHEATEKIKIFRRELCQYFERRPKPTQIYQLSISLFPVTKIKNKSGGYR